MKTKQLSSLATGGDRYRLADIPATSSTRVLVDEVDVLYRRTSELHDSVQDNRRDALILDLDERTAERAKDAPRDALSTLSDKGFAWRDVARILDVSVPAVNKWRKGEGITGPNRLRIARLLALLDMLETQFVAEPASWLEIPLRSGVALTPIDLLAEGRYDLVLEYAGTHTGPGNAEVVLNEFAPEWRVTLVDDAFETFVDSEGVVGIRPKDTYR
ncbi:transcriptional regulator [Gordonia hongkongensis]|uniref:transcriptional regulator n=1 Tax=Gordonia hongkongensis TaxID=1701090 RepID=UPI0030CD2812